MVHAERPCVVIHRMFKKTAINGPRMSNYGYKLPKRDILGCSKSHLRATTSMNAT